MAGTEKLLFGLKVFDQINPFNTIVHAVTHSKYFDLGDSNHC